MADSNITKRALAAALKALMKEMPFEKITISDICEKCNMNRKSFYYHFKDKYDLVNWIFDTEFLAVAVKKEYINRWDKINDLCQYFYANHNFYSKVLNVTGQNSLSDHMKELFIPVIFDAFQEEAVSPKMRNFQIAFFSDALTLAFQRWLTDKNPLSAEEFVEQSQLCLEMIQMKLQELERDKRL